jgi:hypothetical protein
MKRLLGFIFFCFIAGNIQAQTATASLNITFTDIQSVKIIDLPDQAKADPSKRKPGKNVVILMNPVTSQVRQFDSLTDNMDLFFQELQTASKLQGSDFIATANTKNTELLADLNKKSKTSIPLVVYQIDPR